MRPSARVWAAAAAAGVGLVARGRLLPAVGAGDADIWRAGPLDPSDLSWLRELAAVFPPAAHALAIPGSRPIRLRSPEALIRDLWDAIADLIARSPAAARTTTSTAFAAAAPTRVGDLAEWLADTTDGLAAGARLGLRIETVPEPPPAGDADDLAGDVDEGGGEDGSGPPFQLVLQLRSNADPSLIVDAAALWNQPETVLARFGPQAETDLLLALRRGAPIWPPLAQALRAGQPVGDRPGRRRAGQPARPGGRGTGGRRDRGAVAVQPAGRRPQAEGRPYPGAGEGDRRRVRARGAAGFPVAAHSRRGAARRRRDRRAGRGEAAADQAAGPLGDARPGPARPPATSAPDADARGRGARRCARGLGGDRRRDGDGGRRRPAGRPGRPGRRASRPPRRRSSLRPG